MALERRQLHVLRRVNLTSALLVVATAYQLKSTDFTEMSINLADKLGNKQLFILPIRLVNKQLIILLIFVNNEHFVNAVTMGKVHVDKMRMQTMREHGFEAKAIIRLYTRTNNGN